MKNTFAISALLTAMMALGGCATDQQQPASGAFNNGATTSNYGRIESIRALPAHAGSSGAGAVVGGLLGAVLGNQVGGGSGRTVATVAGAVGGAVVGNNVERSRDTPAADRYEIRVRLDNGDSSTVVQDNINNLRDGDRVRLVDGHAYRY